MDLNQVLQALRNADAAGDVEAARKLAQIARQMAGLPAPAQPPETTFFGQVGEAFKGLVPGAVGLVESAAIGASAILPEEQERAAREAIARVAGAAKAPFAPAPGYEQTVGRKLGEAVGSTAPFLVAGPLGLAGRAAAVGLGVGAGAGEARTRAETEGATAEQRGTATALGTIPGALEIFAPFRILSRIPEGEVLGAVSRVKRALVAGGEEAAQEAASGLAQNMIARGVYKPEQELIEGLGEQAAYGGATGAIVQGLMDLALGRRARGAGGGAEPPAPIDIARQEAAKREAERAAKAAKAAPPPVPSTQAIIDETLTKPVSQASAQLTLAIERLKEQPASPQRNAAIKELEAERGRREREDAERVQAGKKVAEGFLGPEEAAAQTVTPRAEFDPTQARREEIERLRAERETLLVKGKPPAAKSPARRRFDELDARLVEIGGGRWTPPVEAPAATEPTAPTAPTVGLTEQDLLGLGLSKRQPIFKRLLGKDSTDKSVLDDIEDYLNKGLGSEESRTKLTEFKDRFAPKPPEATAPPTPETPSAPSVPTEPEPTGAGVSVAGGPPAVSPTEGTGAVEPVRVVPPVEDAGRPAAGEGQQPPAVTEPPAPALAPTDLTPEQRADLAEEVERISGLMSEEEYDAYVENHVDETGGRIKPGAENIQAARELVRKYGGDTQYRTVPQSPVVTNRVSDAELRRIVNDVEKALGGKLDITILDDVTDLDNKQQPGSRAGSLSGDKLYLFRSGIPDGIEGLKTIFHEVFHKGLSNLLPRAEYQALMTKFYNQSAAVRQAADAYLASTTGKKDTEGLSPQDAQVLAVEEALAEMAEETDLSGSTLRQLGNFFARLADRFGMPNLARAIRIMGLDPLQAFIREAIQAGIRPSVGEGATRFRPGTPAFDRWFGDSKMVNKNGKPLVVYRGIQGEAEGALNAEPREGYNVFASDSPAVAATYGMPGEEVGLPGSIVPVFVKANKLIEFPVGKQFDKVEFDRRARTLRPGEVLVARQVIDIGPMSPEAYKIDRQKLYTYPSNIYAWGRGTATKSAIGNVGAYGQRPITEAEAKRFGMTKEEADEAQAAGDIRFRTVTPQTEAATAGIDAIGKESKKSLADFLRRNPALAARIKATDYLAGLDDPFTKAYAGKVRDALGNLNPMVLVSRALDHGRVSLEAMRIGGLEIKNGLVQATELTVPEDSKEFPLIAGKTISYQKDVIERLVKEAKQAKKTFDQYNTQVSTVLYGHREYNLREHNRRVEAQAQALEAAGKQKQADKLRDDQIIELFIKDDAKLDELETEFQRNTDIQEISQTLDAIRFNNLDVLVQTNRLSPEKAQEYKDNIGYIPFKRIVEYEAGFDTARGGNRGIAALKNIRKLEGSDRQSLSVIENFAGFMDWATREAMMNDASLSALKDMELLKLAKKGANNEPGATGANITVYDKGEKVEYYVPDPAHSIVFTFSPPELSSVFKGLQTASNILRAGVTVFPPFAVKQIFDDISRAYAYSGVKHPMELTARILSSFPANWYREAFGKTQNATVKEMAKLGIFGTFDFSRSGNVRNILQEAGAEGGKVKALGRTIMRVMEAGAKASDVSVRQAVYEQVLKETGDPAAAESRAREVINFSRRGSSGFMNTMISIVPFFNAYARGMDKLAVAGAGKVVGQSTGQARAMFYKRMGVMTAMGLSYALMMSDDDEYNALPDHVRDTNWILPYGKELGFTPGIPVPAELAFFFKAIPERVVRYYKLQGTDEEKAAIDIVGNLLKRGVDVFSSPNVTPQLLRPFVENISNYSWFLGRPLESQGQLALDPFQRFGTGTSDFAKVSAEALEEAYQQTGIELLRISPIKIENAIRGIFGTTAGAVLAITDAFLNPTRTDRPLHQMLGAQLTGASAVMKDAVGTRFIDSIYDLEKDVNRVNATYNRLLEREPEKADEYLRSNVGLLSIRPAVSSLMKAIKSLNEQASIIDRAKDISASERRTLINQLRAQQNELAQQSEMLRTQARRTQQGM